MGCSLGPLGAFLHERYLHLDGRVFQKRTAKNAKLVTNLCNRRSIPWSAIGDFWHVMHIPLCIVLQKLGYVFEGILVVPVVDLLEVLRL